MIAGEAELKGTFRTLNEETRMRVSELLEKDAQHAAALYGCTAEIENRRMSDPVVNDQRACALARASAEGLAASDRIGPQKTMMLGERFCQLRRHRPVLIRAGRHRGPRETDGCRAP